mmetsp:Transcript_52631/g.139799  ORF Transcript_52631/g.139799 Transcript_52631/m.139799 type:complete len:292 (+) Transcript_52631:644-1519(+)
MASVRPDHRRDVTALQVRDEIDRLGPLWVQFPCGQEFLHDFLAHEVHVGGRRWHALRARGKLGACDGIRVPDDGDGVRHHEHFSWHDPGPVILHDGLPRVGRCRGCLCLIPQHVDRNPSLVPCQLNAAPAVVNAHDRLAPLGAIHFRLHPRARERERGHVRQLRGHLVGGHILAQHQVGAQKHGAVTPIVVVILAEDTRAVLLQSNFQLVCEAQGLVQGQWPEGEAAVLARVVADLVLPPPEVWLDDLANVKADLAGPVQILGALAPPSQPTSENLHHPGEDVDNAWTQRS